MADTLYQVLGSAIEARRNCIERNNTEWHNIWETMILNLVKRMMPSGAGLDNGTTIDLENSTGEELLFRTSFHHMNYGGYYDGWTDHAVTVTPSFHGINVRVGGRNRNDIKDHVRDTFYEALNQTVTDDVKLAAQTR